MFGILRQALKSSRKTESELAFAALSGVCFVL